MSTPTPRTDHEDKVIRHYCDISWQERYDLMCEHAGALEKELPTFGDHSAQHESDEDAFNGWNRDIDGYEPTLWDAYLFGLKRRNARLESERDQLRAELATCKDASESLIESLRAELEKLKGGAK